MASNSIISKYKFSQGTHCTKIGSKCVEERWFNNGPCLLAEKVRFQYGLPIKHDEPHSAPPKKP